MTITDWGIAAITVDGLKLSRDSGVIWKVTRSGQQAGFPGGSSLLLAIGGLLALVVATGIAVYGHAPARSLGEGALAGMIAGVVMGVVAMLVAVVFLDLPWYAPPRFRTRSRQARPAPWPRACAG